MIASLAGPANITEKLKKTGGKKLKNYQKVEETRKN